MPARNRRARGWFVLAGLTLIFATAGALPAAERAHPLEGPDTVSPRGTLNALRSSVDRGYALYEKGDPRWREEIGRAKRCIDSRQIPPRVREQSAAEVALMLKEILDRIELPPERQIPGRAEVEAVGLKEWTIPHTEIELVLIEDGDRSGEFLVSAETVGRMRDFFEKVRHLPYKPGLGGAHYDDLRFGGSSQGVRNFVRRFPSWAKTEIASQTVWQWIAYVLLLGLAVLAIAVGSKLGAKWKRPVAVSSGWNRLAPFILPMTMILVARGVSVALVEQLGIYGPAGGLTRLGMTALSAVGVAWLVAVLFARVTEHIIIFAKIERPLNQQLFRATNRVLTILVLVGIFLYAGQLMGAPIGTLLAGLGVGGIAIALAAQSTVENLIGGINLYADRPVRVGELCKIGGVIGVLENVGLRSAKIRTLERSTVTIPNAQFAKLHLENLSTRDRMLLKEKLSLSYETTPAQLRDLLTKLHAAFLADPRFDDEKARARFLGFGQYFLEVEIYAYALTSEWPQFLEIREQFLLEVMRIVEESGTRLALPTEIHYQAQRSTGSAGVGLPAGSHESD